MNIKNNGTKAIIMDYRDKNKIDRIKYILGKEARYYSEEELEALSQKFDFSIDKIIQHVFCAGQESEYLEEYKKVIREKKKIWIGDTGCSKSFAEKQAKFIIKEAEKNSKTKSSRYNCRHLQVDLASDAITYILQKCGEIGKNFEENDKIAKKLIRVKIITYIKYKCIEMSSKQKEISFHMKLRNNKNEIDITDVLNKGIEDKSQNIQDEVEEKVLSEKEANVVEENTAQTYAEILMQNINQGLDLQESLKLMENKLELPKEEILKALKNYMIACKRVRETKNGEFIIGE